MGAGGRAEPPQAASRRPPPPRPVSLHGTPDPAAVEEVRHGEGEREQLQREPLSEPLPDSVPHATPTATHAAIEAVYFLEGSASLPSESVVRAEHAARALHAALLRSREQQALSDHARRSASECGEEDAAVERAGPGAQNAHWARIALVAVDLSRGLSPFRLVTADRVARPDHRR